MKNEKRLQKEKSAGPESPASGLASNQTEIDVRPTGDGLAAKTPLTHAQQDDPDGQDAQYWWEAADQINASHGMRSYRE